VFLSAEEMPGQTGQVPEVEGCTIVVGQPSPDDPFRSARSVSLLDGENLAEQVPRSTPESLGEVPGAFVQATNRGGGSPIIRGMVGPGVLLLVDGVRLNNSVYRAGPLQYLNLIDPGMLDRIEVMRGPGSVLYGSDAIGGVVHLVPLRPMDARGQDGVQGGGGLRLRLSSADRGMTGSAHGTVGIGGFGALVAGGIKSFDDLRGGGDVGDQPWSGYRQWSALGAVTHRIDDGAFAGLRISANYLFSRIDGAGRTDKLDAGTLTVYDNEDHLAWMRLAWRVPTTRMELTASFQDFFERKDDRTLDDRLEHVLKTARDDTRVRTLGVDLQSRTSLLGDRLRFHYGGLYYRDFVGSGRWARPATGAWTESPSPNYPDDSRYESYGLHLLAEGDAVRTDCGHVFRLSAGYRFHGMGGGAPALDDREAVSYRAHGHVGQAGLQYLFRDQVNLAVTWSEGFRAPNLQEAVMVGDSGRYWSLANPDLGPESTDTLEALARFRFWRIRASASGWVSWARDLIQMKSDTWNGQDQVNGKDVVRKQNVGRGMLWGVEAEAAAYLGVGMSLRGNLAYTRGDEIVSGGPDVPLSRIPPLFGTVGLRWDAPRMGGFLGFAEVFVRAAARQDRLSPEDVKDSRIPDGGTPGWTTVNLRLGGTIHDSIRLGLLLENLSDTRYKYHGSGIYMPGFNALLSLGASI
jgi:outer membrane receptor protein involved in Fe transport